MKNTKLSKSQQKEIEQRLRQSRWSVGPEDSYPTPKPTKTEKATITKPVVQQPTPNKAKKSKKIFRGKYVLGFVLIVLVIASTTGFGFWYKTNKDQSQSPIGSEQTSNNTSTQTKTDVKSTESTPIYVYTDNLNGSVVEVTRQKFDATTITNLQQQLEKAAKTSPGASIIVVSPTAKIFTVETNSTGTKLLTVIKDNELISLKSTKYLDNEVWKNFVRVL